MAQGGSQEIDLLNTFLRRASDRTIYNRISADYKVTDQQFLFLAEKVTQKMIAPDLDYQPGVTVKARAENIATAVSDTVRQNLPSANALLKERMVIQGLYDWTRTHIVYNVWLADLSRGRNIRKKHWEAKDLFLAEQPNAVCVGFASVFTDMANSLGIESFNVVGVTRRQFDNNKLPLRGKDGGHQWALCRQRDGFLLPVDPTNSAVALSRARALQGRVPEPITLPNFPEDWALHFAIYFETCRPYKVDPLPAKDAVQNSTYEEWRLADVRALRASYARKVGMTWFTSAVVDWPQD